MKNIDITRDLDPSQHYIVTTACGNRSSPIPPCAFPKNVTFVDVIKGERIQNLWSQNNQWNPQPYKELIEKLVKLIDSNKSIYPSFIDGGIREDIPVSEMISSQFDSLYTHLKVEASPAYGLLRIRITKPKPINITFDINIIERDLITIHPDNDTKYTTEWHKDLVTTLRKLEP